MVSNQEAIRRLARVIHDNIGNQPPLPSIYPDQLAPVVCNAKNGEHSLELTRWGFPPTPNYGTRPVTNVRNTKSPYWRARFKPAYHCLVPATWLCEYTDKLPKVPHWFALGDNRPLFTFTGIWRPGLERAARKRSGARQSRSEPTGY